MEENNNIFVSSRGILKSCDYFPITQYSSIRQMYNYPNIEKIKNIKNPSIYVCSSAIQHFIQVFLPLIEFSFILVSGDCDETIPDEILTQTEFNKLINDKRLKHWFCQNMTVEHEKITKIPIGLDYHTLRTRPLWGPISGCEEQEKMLTMIIKKAIPFWERKIMCYSNFHFTMDTKLGYDRKDAFNKIDNNLILYEREITNIKSFPFPFEIEYEYSALDKAITAEYVIAVEIKYGENLIYSTSSQIIHINQNSNKLLKNIVK